MRFLILLLPILAALDGVSVSATPVDLVFTKTSTISDLAVSVGIDPNDWPETINRFKSRHLSNGELIKR
jgi:hypothetical protein